MVMSRAPSMTVRPLDGWQTRWRSAGSVAGRCSANELGKPQVAAGITRGAFRKQRRLRNGNVPENTRPSADEALARLIEGNQTVSPGRGAQCRLPARDAGRSRQGPATLRDHPRLQRFARAARVDFRCRPGRTVRDPRGRQHSLAGDCGEPAVRGVVFADAVVRGTRPRGVRGGRRGAGDQARGGAVSFSGSTAAGEHRPRPSRFRSQLSPEEQLSRAVESNVRWTVRQILDSPEGQARVAEGRMKIVGAVYEIETGRVRFLPPDERT